MDTAIAGNEELVIEVSEETRWVAPRINGVALAVESSLWAESSVFAEQFAAVIGIEHELEVGVPQEASWGIDGLEGDAGVVSETGAHHPARLLLDCGCVGRGDDLGVDGGSLMGDEAGGAARCGRTERNVGANAESGTTGHGGSGVFGGDDVGLHRIFSSVGWEAGGHNALVEGALCADTVVSSDTEDDRTLFGHWVVSGRVGSWTVVERRQRAGRSVASTDRPVVRLAFDDSGEESVGDSRVTSVLLHVYTGEQPVLEVGHDPRATARPGAPDVDIAKVNGFHVSVAGIATAGFSVTVVEAAATVEVGSVQYRVHPLSSVAFCCAGGGVVAVASARRNEDTVGLVAVQCDWSTSGTCEVVKSIGFWSLETTWRRLGEMIVVARLVEDGGDDTGCVCTEGVLGGGVGHTTSGQWPDVEGCTVGASSNLVEATVERVE